jgi:hypothetical protein
MAQVTTNPSTDPSTNPSRSTTTQAVTRPGLVIGGRVTDRHGAPVAVGVQLTVALEAVVAENAEPTVYDMYGVELRTDANGRVEDSYDLADDVRVILNGWVKCTVQIQARLPDAPVRTKVVRWMRPSSAELINGLSALLADIGCARDRVNKQ